MTSKKSFIKGLVTLTAVLALFGFSARADVRLPNLFSENMVLQQGMRVAIWGWADEGEVVTVTFRGQTVKTTAHDGKWMVRLSKLKAGGPDTLTVEGKNRIAIANVYVGEVWLASGQSNMEFKLNRSYESQADIDSATNSMIFLLDVPNTKALQPTNNIGATWHKCSPEEAAKISAVGYYFIREIQKDRNVPVGLIESDWGGSPAEVWMSEAALSANPRFKTEILDEYPAVKKRHEAALAKYREEKDAAAKAGKPFDKKAPTPGWRPTELYNGMIAPLIPYGIKGAIWYQGEANAGRAEQYRSLFPAMINNWRQDWGEGKFPFFAVQLAPYLPIKDQPSDSAWAELREAQLRTAKEVPNYGIAVITDVGNPDNIHPVKKKPVGERLALAARGVAYGEKIEYSGPIFKSIKTKGNELVVSFDHADSGLEARDGELKGFAICGPDHKFVWAKAEIDPSGKKVIVSSPEVANPVAVRYGWADCPVVNLWNKAGLPASPFRSDDFPMVTAKK